MNEEDVNGQGPVVEDGVVVGNVYDKYGTTNPVARWLMRGFFDSFRQLVERSGARIAHEVGCGEGHLTLELEQLGLDARGSDFSEQIIRRARGNAAAAGASVSFEQRSVYELDEPDAAELIVCCEVLEHLEDPDAALEKLVAAARPWLLASVPREPLWRVLNMLRFKYLRAWGNTPGHLNHWSRRGFLKLLLQYHLEVVEVRSPLPWTMVLCRSLAA